MITLASTRWPRRSAPAGLLVACAIISAFAQSPVPAVPLVQLERELALAATAREPASVREIVRRLVALDPSPERQVGCAETLLALGMYADLEGVLASLEHAGATPPRAVEKLRAQAAAARGEWAVAVAHWSVFLATVDLPHEARIPALDEQAHALMQQHDWRRARATLDERIALLNATTPRLQRATILLRLREWIAAGEDFAHLGTAAPDDSTVKSLLPRWERAHRSREQLQAVDTAVAQSPGSFAARLDRAMTMLRAGLWQNAAEDLAAAIQAHPASRMPHLLLARLTDTHDFDPQLIDAPEALIDRAPLLAPSNEWRRLTSQLDARAAAWNALREADDALVSGPHPLHLPALRTEQARLVLEFGHPRRALEDIRDVLRENPALLAAHCVEIAALLTLNRAVEADAAVTRAVQIHRAPDGKTDTELDRLAGLVWQAQGKHAQAIAAFSSYLAEKRTADILRARAKSLRFRQQFAEAADDLAAANALEAAPAGGAR